LLAAVVGVDTERPVDLTTFDVVARTVELIDRVAELATSRVVVLSTCFGMDETRLVNIDKLVDDASAPDDTPAIITAANNAPAILKLKIMISPHLSESTLAR
jgi:hypothetical protein